MKTEFNSYSYQKQELIEKSRLDDQPLPGDIVEYTTQYGDWYPNAHIAEVNKDSILICEVASIAHVWEENGKPYFGRVSGGAWSEIPKGLQKVGQRLKTFCYYDHSDILRVDTVEFQAKVNVWSYREPNPLFGDYTTRLYRRLHVHFDNKPDMFGYRIFVYGNGGMNYMAFHNNKEYLAWLNTYKGVEFTVDTGKVVFLYRKQEQLISEEEWEKLSLPIDTRWVNGLIDVKYHVDDESKLITEYRYTNSGNQNRSCQYNKPYGKAVETL